MGWKGGDVGWEIFEPLLHYLLFSDKAERPREMVRGWGAGGKC